MQLWTFGVKDGAACVRLAIRANERLREKFGLVIRVRLSIVK